MQAELGYVRKSTTRDLASKIHRLWKLHTDEPALCSVPAVLFHHGMSSSTAASEEIQNKVLPGSGLFDEASDKFFGFWKIECLKTKYFPDFRSAFRCKDVIDYTRYCHELRLQILHELLLSGTSGGVRREQNATFFDKFVHSRL